MLTLAPLTLHSWTWKVSMTDTVYVLRDARGALAKVSGLTSANLGREWPFSTMVVWSATAIWGVKKSQAEGKFEVRRLKIKDVPLDEVTLTEDRLANAQLAGTLPEATPSPSPYPDKVIRLMPQGYSVVDETGALSFRVGNVPMYLQLDLSLLKKEYAELPDDARQLLDEVFRYPESRKSVVIRDALLAVSDNLPKTGKNKS